jgi:hypothetical protein
MVSTEPMLAGSRGLNGLAREVGGVPAEGRRVPDHGDESRPSMNLPLRTTSRGDSPELVAVATRDEGLSRHVLSPALAGKCARLARTGEIEEDPIIDARSIT